LFEDNDILVPFWFLWISETSAKASEKQFGIPYSLWEKDGYISIVEGNNVGPYGVRRKITEINDTNQIVIMGYDEWNTRDLAIELQDELEIETVVERQGYGLSVGIKKMKELIKGGKFLHNGNPIVTWTLENLLAKEDDELRIKFVKPKDHKKIDPWISLAMAVRNWMEVRPKRSVYSDRGVITLD
jgi:phage terminase large subunit-like protein